ncbi:MAG TPA: IPT/TIG domain-containing protein [Planctomycetota bacterium]|nr:IPT/TIG domain-containing protein [Planctomycetota bacterium]HNR99085.1 IPT/TIG domain-containing protein [Planctomycetota bacterium]HNU26797.1 IPT/TIG domain-containing protein [Planctomycetota bacterium]HOE30803.1 IPT/TIG domain-containing protein [Planctomycetota bacterium]HOE87835.1 IPT/TIG domain-containing protein [Planctomycetota bacterium]
MRPASSMVLSVGGISPGGGPSSGGTLVTVRGGGFDARTTVEFNGYLADRINVSDPWTIQCTTPPSRVEGCVDVIVATPRARAVLKQGFCYNCALIDGLSWSNNRGVINFSWQIFAPGSHIDVFRGGSPIATLPGDAVGFSAREASLGVFRYTFVVAPCGSRASTVVSLGRLRWDAPAEFAEGFLVYVGPDPRAFPDREHPPFNIGYRIEVPLGELQGAGMLPASGRWYFAVASYSYPFTSELSNRVSCDYSVVLGAAP